jgi:hypothetical protein
LGGRTSVSSTLRPRPSTKLLSTNQQQTRLQPCICKYIALLLNRPAPQRNLLSPLNCILLQTFLSSLRNQEALLYRT